MSTGADRGIRALRILAELDPCAWAVYAREAAHWREGRDGTVHGPERGKGTGCIGRPVHGHLGDMLSGRHCRVRGCVTLRDASEQGERLHREVRTLTRLPDRARRIREGMEQDPAGQWQQACELVETLEGEGVGHFALAQAARELLDDGYPLLVRELASSQWERQRVESAVFWVLRWHQTSPLRKLYQVVPGTREPWTEAGAAGRLRSLAEGCDGTTRWARDFIQTVRQARISQWPDFLIQGLSSSGTSAGLGSEQIHHEWVALVSHLAWQAVGWWQFAEEELEASTRTLLVLDDAHEAPYEYEAYRHHQRSSVLITPYCVGLHLNGWRDLPVAELDGGTTSQEIDIVDTLVADGAHLSVPLHSLVIAARELAR